MYRNPVLTEEQKKQISNLYENSTLNFGDIGKHIGGTYAQVQYYIESSYPVDYRRNRKKTSYRLSKLGDKNPMFGKRREEVSHFIGEVGDGYGYLQEVKPEWYTGRRGSKHVFKHHLVVCEALGLTCIPKGFVVHHVDGDPKNNELNNLALLTASAHSRLHQFQKRL